MRIFRKATELSRLSGPTVLAVGVFDGLHLGHQEVIRTAAAKAHQWPGGEMAVLTFHPHPASVLRPNYAPRILSCTKHKHQLMKEAGVLNLLDIAFTPEFSRRSAQRFIHDLVAGSGKLAAICVGRDWAFGHKREGNLELLRQEGEKLGFELLEVPPVLYQDEPISSTRVRRYLADGQLPEAEACLGRRYSLLGVVTEGAGLGRGLGFPTANLTVDNEIYPGNGVYAVFVSLGGAMHGGVANIGIRPTVERGGRRTLEVHLLDFSQSIYGQEMEVWFVHRLREELKFSSLAELKARIGHDVDEARAALQGKAVSL